MLKVRENGRVVNAHALVAVGVNADGYREILGVDVTSAEDGAGWLASFRGLVARGLSVVKLVTSDAHTPRAADGLVLVDIAPRVEIGGTAEIMAFMCSGLDGFASLDDAAAAIAAYIPHRVRKPNPAGAQEPPPA